MTLLTDDERARMLDNGAAAARGERRDSPPIVKLFTPDARATWLLTELDPNDGDTAYGLCDAGIGFPELGTIRISYLETMRGPKGSRVVRDPHFVAVERLSEYVSRARRSGSAND
jgi:hypothetical protein